MAKSFYGLIGYPLTHTFSPDYFKEKFRKEGIDADYTAFPLATIDEFPAFLKAHPELNGLNVTIPYKTSIMPFLSQLSEGAKAVGAVNCIDIRDGKLIGHNTDSSGFANSIKPLLKPHHKHALILGNGGAAKGVAYALRQNAIEFRVVSRGAASGPFLPYSQVTPELLETYTLLINTTPLGMYPNTDRSPEIPYNAITQRHLLFDVIYNPEETQFLRLGKEQGAAVKNGLEMLHLQAEGSWDIWQGKHLLEG